MRESRHNHATRDIKPLGSCPACDEYYNRRIPRAENKPTLKAWRLYWDECEGWSVDGPTMCNGSEIVLKGDYDKLQSENKKLRDALKDSMNMQHMSKSFIGHYEDCNAETGELDDGDTCECGMDYRQVLELKEFWMRHHEELPKWANAKSAKQEGE